jgi:hypothetical protein
MVDRVFEECGAESSSIWMLQDMGVDTVGWKERLLVVNGDGMMLSFGEVRRSEAEGRYVNVRRYDEVMYGMAVMVNREEELVYECLWTEWVEEDGAMIRNFYVDEPMGYREMEMQVLFFYLL